MTEAATSDWRHRAECRRHDPDTWFPVGNTGPVVAEQVAAAKAICGGCPARVDCLEWALATRQEFGVWGGMSEDERRNLRRRQARAAAADAKALGPGVDRVPSPHQVLKPPKPRDPRTSRRLDPDHNVSVPADEARRLIEAAYEAGLDRVRVAGRLGVAPKWVSSVSSGAKPRISLAYERRVKVALGEYAEPGATPTAPPRHRHRGA